MRLILDPPAFIKRRKDIAQGQAAYRKLNQLAMNLIEGDGLLVSCSCSYHLEEGQLVTAVQAAARHSLRFAQILAFGGQSPDHRYTRPSPSPAISKRCSVAFRASDSRNRYNFPMLHYPG